MTKTYFEDLAEQRFGMTKDTDIIRRAADLADGWTIKESLQRGYFYLMLHIPEDDSSEYTRL